MKIKLFYNKAPGVSLTEDSDDLMIWGGYECSTFHHILNTLGIDYEWTNDPTDSVVILDIGSSNFNSDGDKLLSICDRFTEQYGKFILFTSQEPINQDKIDMLMQKYPNMFIMDIKYSAKDKENYIPFPSFFIRNQNNVLNEVIPHAHIDLTNVDRKNYIFNNLKFRWTIDKFLAQYYVHKNELENLSTQLERNKNLYSNAKIYWLMINLSEFINIFELN